ncbi:heterokaryon incompatibility protein-domain-containing protein [Xylaria cf. heliscus]|nr:heterokaryon incompatibility protein-domain-containing protein [Xylaria cf. heliscus]
MRLINTSTFDICEFPGDSPTDYAILSHTWGEEECTLRDMMLRTGVELRKGYAKIRFCCEQAVRDGLSWAWVDTCCIDQTSTAELSEAINSMFRWYSNAKICYAYLADVTDQTGFAFSRWFRRGWTLQELIAPKVVQFYSSDWTFLGSKSELECLIQKITGIDGRVLSTGTFGQVCVAKRMSWAAKRDTTRVEDEAYSLMGLFGVNMPLIYGEGKKAFLRLQQEIMRVTDDQSLFAWGAPLVFPDMHLFLRSRTAQIHGLFADSPKDFGTNHDLIQVPNQEDSSPPVIHGNGVRVEYPVCTKGGYNFIVLACTTRARARAYIGIPIKRWSGSLHARCGQLVLIFPEHWTEACAKVLVIKEPPAGRVSSEPEAFQLVRVPNTTRIRKQDQFVLDEVYCAPHARYDPTEHSIAFSSKHRGIQGALFFTSSSILDKKRKSVVGVYPIHCFAVVLSNSSFGPRTIFIPIVRDAHADEDFHKMLSADGELARRCMTKSQLKERICANRMEGIFYFQRRLEQLLAAWALDPWDRGSPTQRNLEISVDLDVEQINLLDEAIFVSIDIYEVTMKRRVAKPVFLHSTSTFFDQEPSKEWRGDYRLDWVTIDQLEWFVDRTPWEPSKDAKF